MTAARRLAVILAGDVGVREHRDGASENRTNGVTPDTASLSAAIMVAADWGYSRVLFGLTLSGRWSRAIEWRVDVKRTYADRDGQT